MAKAFVILHWSRHVRMGALPLSAPGLLKNSGNKAFRLALLRRKGFPVPDGVVLTHDALTRFRAASAQQKTRLTTWVSRALGGGSFAVRSSAAREDGEAQSFAGVFDSQLNVAAEDLPEAIGQVLVSFGAEHASAYDDAGDANILIQPMLGAEQAGVLFTQAPDAPGQMLVEYVEGLGEELVSGRAVPHSQRFGRVSRKPIGESGPFNMGELLELGGRVEEIFGTPQDIEWVRVGGHFQIVQTRDITAAGDHREWHRILGRLAGTRPEERVLVQDDSTEILPRPTTLSLDYMRALWARGGSVERACASLGLRYRPPAAGAPFLVRVFGRLYVDLELRKGSRALLTRRARRSFERDPDRVADRYRDTFLPALDHRLARIAAIDFKVLPADIIRREVAELFDEFITDIHVEAERINIAAGYYVERAVEVARQHGIEAAGLLGGARGLGEVLPKGSERNRAAILRHLGHRAVYDYELSEPRFCEDQDGLEAVLSGLSPVARPSLPIMPDEVAAAVSRAQVYQSLKEGAKNQALRFLAEIRRALLALDLAWSFDGHVFELTRSEIAAFDVDPGDFLPVARRRRTRRGELLAHHALPASLSLAAVEAESGGASITFPVGQLGGQRVSGMAPARGRAFVVDPETSEKGGRLNGFETGDVLVCRTLHPSWIPYLVRAGAAVVETGGWLSHMAIIARERDIPLIVQVRGWQRIETGDIVTIEEDGRIGIQPTGPEDAGDHPAQQSTG